jgi:hypothetical protein
MFEVSAEVIGALDDKQMRELVARLCRAELRVSGLPESGVTAGGDQRAPDGGIDVRVEVDPASGALDFIPSSFTGFQVKKEKSFGAERVKGEMAPAGVIRPVLQELANVAGAYVIVNGGQSVADKGLNERRKAMRATAAALHGAERLTLDFYDGDRLAEWANQHPGVVLWVLETLGRGHSGYRPWGHWCVAAEDALIADEAGRLEDRNNKDGETLSLLAGIELLRESLRQPAASVRLVGVSGTGKTRLTQALFDGRLGDGALAPDLAVYTDIGDGPTPSVGEALGWLMRDGRRVVLVVDNCPPGLHRSLARELARRPSGVSLLTIEYDIRADLPEETQVYRLLPGSGELIDTLLKRHAPHVAEIDRRRLVKWSEGNTRLALALARQVGKGESLSNLADAELFERLLYQGKDKDGALLRSAEVAAIVYSFDVETGEGEEAEMPLLARLAGQTPDDFHRHVEEMRERDLVQRRGPWRAVLPQALAHHLAKRALSFVAPASLKRFIDDAPPRLQKSFTRQLGNLHDSERALAIAREWLAPRGRLGDYAGLSEDERAMFRNMAPIDPATTLQALERSLPTLVASMPGLDDEVLDDVVTLLRSLAYEREDFPDAIELLSCLCTLPEASEGPKEQFAQLFWISVSGTHATPTQRLAVIDALLRRNDESSRMLALEALGAMLDVDQRVASHRFEFGARQRDYGWRPKTHAGISEWLTAALTRLEEQSIGGGKFMRPAREILAKRFPGLWKSGFISDALERALLAVGEAGFWSEGFHAVRRTIWLTAKSGHSESKERLTRLAERLAPGELTNRVRAWVLSDQYDPLDDQDANGGEPGDSYRVAEQRAEHLGVEASGAPDLLAILLPELVASRSSRITSFGKGLAQAAKDADALWWNMVSAFEQASPEQRPIILLRGFLAGLHPRSPETVNLLLDGAVESTALAAVFPYLQTAVPLDEAAVKRLHVALAVGIAPVSSFEQIAYGRAIDVLESEELVPLIEAIAAREGGWDVAVEILSMRYFSARNGPSLDAALIECGRRLLCRLPLAVLPDDRSDRLQLLASGCLVGEEAAEHARAFCRRLINVASHSRCSLARPERLISKIFKLQSIVALDEFIGSLGADVEVSQVLFWEDMLDEAIAQIDEPALLAWLRHGQAERYLQLARKLTLFRGSSHDDQVSLSLAAITLISHAPDRGGVLERLRTAPSSVTSNGSIAAVFDQRRKALGQLRVLNDPLVDEWLDRVDEELRQEGESWRAFTQDRD